MIIKYTNTDIDVLARTIYGEARGEYYRVDGGMTSLIAVANVICNRYLQSNRRYGSSIADVCQKAYQFSCWNKSDPNLPVINAVQSGDDVVFDMAYEVARNVLSSKWPDLTGGANHYHASTMQKKPNWAAGKKELARIGQHIFYNL